ncbi:MAG: hypothetical protein M5R36_00265 [Deltaproteobacteria bacterium]|nr:hypothetical protein [Deltaproteobacteria bacterium]
MAILNRINPPTEKKRCCHAARSGILMDHPLVRKIFPCWMHRYLGLALLVFLHGTTLMWEAGVALFVRRYRPVLRFHWRYFRDVMSREMKPVEQTT